MSTAIEQRIVEMKFDRKGFSEGVKDTLKDLDTLEKGLEFKKGISGLKGLQQSVDSLRFDTLVNGIQGMNDKLLQMQSVGYMVFDNLKNSAANWITNMVKSLSIDQVSDGFAKYENKIDSVKTMVNSTSRSVEDVNKVLRELNDYSDQTIYSFADMTSNISKFTNAGVSLEDAAMAIKGISNEAAMSGANAQEASRAMYNFGQALSSGAVKLIDWKSIENANMATKSFKEELLKTAEELGTVVKVEGGYITATAKSKGKTDEAFDAVQKFNDSLSDQWMTSEVLTKTLSRYADENSDIGKKAFAAAKEVTTFNKMLSILREQVSTGWTKSFEILFGGLDEATKLWTGVNNVIGGFLSKVSQTRNGILEMWKAAGARKDVFDGFTNLYKVLRNVVQYVGLALETLFGHRTLQNLDRVKSFFADRKAFGGNLVIIQKMSDVLISFSKTFKKVTDDIFSLFDTENEESRAFLEAIYQAVQSLLVPLRAVFTIVSGLTKQVLPRAAKLLFSFANSIISLLAGIGYAFTSKELQQSVYKFADAVVSVFSSIMKIFDVFQQKVIGPLYSNLFIKFEKFIHNIPSLLNPTLSFIARIIQEISKQGAAFISGIIDNFERFIRTATVAKDTTLRLSVNIGRVFSSLKAYGKSIRSALDPVIKAVSEMGDKFNLFKSLKVEFNIPGTITVTMYAINKALSKIATSLGTIINFVSTGAIQALSFAFRVLNMVVVNIGVGLLDTISYIKKFYADGTSRISRLRVSFEHLGSELHMVFGVISNTISTLLEKLGLVKEQFSFAKTIRDLGNSIFSTISKIVGILGNVINALRNSIFESILEIINRLNDKLPSIGASLITMAFSMQKSAKKFLDLVDKVGGRINNLWIAVKMLFNLITSTIKNAIDQIDGVSEKLSFVGVVKTILVGVFEVLSRIILSIGKIIGLLGNTAFKVVMFILDTLSKKLPTLTLKIFDTVYGLQKVFASIGTIFDTINRRFGFLKTSFVELFTVVSDKISTLFDKVGTLDVKLNFIGVLKTSLLVIFGIIGKIVGVLGKIIGFIGNTVFEAFMTGLRFIADIMPKVTLNVLDAARGLRQFFASIENSQALRYLQFAFEKVQVAFNQLVRTVRDELLPSLKSIFDFSDDVNLENMFGSFSALGVVKNILSGITGALSTLYSVITDVASTVFKVIAELGRLSLGYITDALYWVSQRIYDIIASINSLLSYIKYSETFNKTLNYIHSGLKLVVNNFKLLVSTISGTLIPVLSEMFGFVDNNKLPKIGGIVDIVTNSFKGLVNVLKIIGGFIGGIISSFDEFAQVMITMTTTAVSNGLTWLSQKLMDVIHAVGQLVNYLKYSPAFQALIDSIGYFTRSLSRLGVVIKANVLKIYEQLVSTMSDGNTLASGNIFVKILTVAFEGLGKAIQIVFKFVGLLLKPVKYLFDLFSPVVVSTLTAAFNGLGWICNKLQLYIYYLRQDLGKIIESFKITNEDVERVTNAISRLKNQFGRTLTTLVKFLKAGLSPIIEKLNKIKTNGLKNLTNWITRLSNKAKESGKTGIGAFLERIANALKSITGRGAKVRSVITSIFSGIKPGVITAVEKGLDLITLGLKKLNDAIWNLWTGASPIIQKIKDVVGPIFKGIGEFFNNFFSNIDIGDKLKNFIDNNEILSDNPLEWLLHGMKQSFDRIVNWLKETQIGQLITNLIHPKDENGESKPIKSFADLLEAIKQFPENAVKTIADFFQQIWNSISNFATDKLDKLSQSFKDLRDAIFGKKDDVDQEVMKDPDKHPFIVLLSKIGDFLGKLVNTVANIGLSGLDTITALFKRIAILAAIFYGLSMLRNTSRAIGGISDFFSSIGKTAKHIKDIAKASKWTIISDFVLDFAKSIAIVAGSIYVISTIPPDDLSRGFTVVALIGGLLVALYALRKYIDGKYSSSGKWAQILENLGGDTQKMGSLISIIVEGFAGLGDRLVKGITKFLNKIGTVALIIGGLIALFGMIALMKSVSNMSLGSIIGSIIKLGIIMAAVFGLYKLLQHNMLKKKQSLKRVAATLLMLNGIIKIAKRFTILHKSLEPIDFIPLLGSIVKMAAIVVSVTGLAYLLDKLVSKSKSLKETVSILLKLTIVFGLLGIVMRIVGSMDVGTMAKALISLAAVVGLMWILSKVANGFKSASKEGLLYLVGALIACAAAIWIFSEAVANILSMGSALREYWDVLAGLLAGFVIFAGVLIGAAILICNIFPVAGPLVLMLAGAVALIGLSFYFVGAAIKMAAEGVVLFIEHMDDIIRTVSGKEKEITEAITVIITAIVVAIGKGLTYLNGIFVEWIMTLLRSLDDNAWEMGKLTAGSLTKFFGGFVAGLLSSTEPILKPVIDKINGWFSNLDLGGTNYDQLAKEAADRGDYTAARYFEEAAANIDANSEKPKEAARRAGSGVIEAYEAGLRKNGESGGVGPLAECTGAAMDEVGNKIDEKTPEIEEKAATSTNKVFDVVAGLLTQDGSTTLDEAAKSLGEGLTWEDIYKNLTGTTEDAASGSASTFAEIYKSLMGNSGIDQAGDAANTDLATGLDESENKPIAEMNDTTDALTKMINDMGFEGLSADQMVGWATGISDNANLPIDGTETVADGAVDAIESKSSDYNEAVSFLLQGMTNVINTEGYQPGGFVEAMGALTDAGCGAIETQGVISSPSKRTYKLGGFLVAGLVNAIKDGNSDASDAGGGIADTLILSMKSALSNAGGLNGLVGSSFLRLSPVLDSNTTLTSLSGLRNKLGTTSPLKMGADIALGKVDISSAVGDLSTATMQGNSDLLSELRRQNDELTRLNKNLENQRLYLDSGAVVGGVISKIDSALGQRAILAGRRG